MPELLVVLAIMALVAAIAAPKFNAFLARQRVRGSLNLLAGDIAYARMMAVRGGRGAVLRFVADPACAAAGRGAGYVYTVGQRGAAHTRHASVRALGGGALCLRANGADSLVFNSRGLVVPFANRTVWSVHGDTRDSLTISAVGRVYRRF